MAVAEHIPAVHDLTQCRSACREPGVVSCVLGDYCGPANNGRLTREMGRCRRRVRDSRTGKPWSSNRGRSSLGRGRFGSN